MNMNQPVNLNTTVDEVVAVAEDINKDNTEIWDAYDSNFNIIPGVTLTRGEYIPDNMYHLVCDVVVQHTDGTYLITQRDYAKQSFGGKWELTCGGSALKGETPIQCALRELHEETGININEWDLNNIGTFKELGKIVYNKHKTIYVVYYIKVGINKGKIKLQKGETIDFEWARPFKLKHMIDAKDIISDRALLFMNGII